MKFWPIILVFILAVSACKQGNSDSSSEVMTEQSDTAKLYAKVMEIHDAAMPRMTEINRLNAHMSAFKATIPPNSNEEIVVPQGYESVYSDLKNADQGMWNWMKEFGQGRKAATPDNKLKFYQDELVKVEKVKMDIDSSIARAEFWIQKNVPSK